jgi:uncharacterized protein
LILTDVNVLVHAHREDSPDHARCLAEIEALVSSSSAFGLSMLALSGFLRIVTHPRVFDPVSPLDRALAFCNYLRKQPHGVALHPGPRHWDIFENLCREANCKGNLIPDAWFAALAIEHGAEWVTMDRGFARFPGLKWRMPTPAPEGSP